MSQGILRVATFNIGDFSTASDSAKNPIELGSGTPKTREEYLEVFQSVGAQLWALQEDSEFFSYPDRRSPYDGLYQSILPNYKRVFTKVYNGKAFLSSYELKDVAPVNYSPTSTSYAPNGVKYSHPWFLTGSITVEGKEISIISLHLDWSCKERRAVQIRDLIQYVKTRKYCIVMGDFNPENRIHSEIQSDSDSVAPGQINMYAVEWAKFSAQGLIHANGGAFGTFGTIMDKGAPTCPYPWDNIMVTPNIKMLDAQVVYRPWMDDHAIVVADLAIE